MNFVFEKISKEEYLNFIDCPDVNSSGIKRFTVSPLVSTLIRFNKIKKISKNFDYSKIQTSCNPDSFLKYIIPSGVTHSPRDWCGSQVKSIFYYLNDRYLRDMKLGKALLLLDQSHEGYHEEWMFTELHNQCIQYGINPRQLIYITGNLIEKRQYDDWANENNIVDKMCVAPYAHFEYMIYETMKNRTSIFSLKKLPNFYDHVYYKTNNLTNIKTYNCLQKRPRAHRAWMFKGLIDHGLLASGINSMNFIEHDNTYYADRLMTTEEYDKINVYLPMIPPHSKSLEQELIDFSSSDSGKYVQSFNEDIVLNTWLSVVSESSFAENNCFISEKTFKSIACSHPFIILGSRFSLKSLQEMGYKTFHPIIDESYDELDTWQRLEAIHKELKRLNSFSFRQKLDWFKQTEIIVKHNIETLINNSKYFAPAAAPIINNHFEKYNVPKPN